MENIFYNKDDFYSGEKTFIYKRWQELNYVFLNSTNK